MNGSESKSLSRFMWILLDPVGSCWILLDASGKVSMELQRRSPVLARRDDWKVGQPSRVVVVRTRLVAFGDLVSSSKFPILKVLTGTLGAEVPQ